MFKKLKLLFKKRTELDVYLILGDLIRAYYKKHEKEIMKEYNKRMLVKCDSTNHGDYLETMKFNNSNNDYVQFNTGNGWEN